MRLVGFCASGFLDSVYCYEISIRVIHASVHLFLAMMMYLEFIHLQISHFVFGLVFLIESLIFITFRLFAYR